MTLLPMSRLKRSDNVLAGIVSASCLLLLAVGMYRIPAAAFGFQSPFKIKLAFAVTIRGIRLENLPATDALSLERQRVAENL